MIPKKPVLDLIRDEPVFGKIMRELTIAVYGILNPSCYRHGQLKQKEWRRGAITMLAFQLVGLTLLVLFFGAMVSGRQRITGR
jgi:hypothetical protein